MVRHPTVRHRRRRIREPVRRETLQPMQDSLGQRLSPQRPVARRARAAHFVCSVQNMAGIHA
jgi:hypothetical protein